MSNTKEPPSVVREPDDRPCHQEKHVIRSWERFSKDDEYVSEDRRMALRQQYAAS
jgi:hypothetical protein